MLRKVVVCALAMLTAGAGSIAPASAVVGGQPATAQTAPYQVAIMLQNWQGKSLACGGFLLTAAKVVTAAHCVDGATAPKLEVRYGGVNRNALPSFSNVSKVSIHPDYDQETSAHDVAVLTLSQPASETDGVEFARLATTTPEPGSDITVTGWGRTDRGSQLLPQELQAASLPVVSQQSCTGDSSEPGRPSDASRFCAGIADGGASVCTHDAGGPAALDGEVVGIMSQGRGCDEPSSPTLVSSAAHYKEWLESQ